METFLMDSILKSQRS